MNQHLQQILDLIEQDKAGEPERVVGEELREHGAHLPLVEGDALVRVEVAHHLDERVGVGRFCDAKGRFHVRFPLKVFVNGFLLQCAA